MASRGGERDEFSILVRAGTVGGLAVCVLCTPLDVVRCSAQAGFAKRKPPIGIVEAFRAALAARAAGPAGGPGGGGAAAAAGGLRTLFRGLAPAAGLAVVSPAAFLFAYEQQRGYKEALEAAAVARAAQTVLVQPLDFARTCRQASVGDAAAAHLERPIFEMVSAGDGLRSLWRGLIPTLLRDVSASLGLWAVYSGLRDQVCGGAADEDLEGAAGVAPVRAAALCSVAAASAAAVSQPFDVIKTRMQVHQMTRSDTSGYRKVSTARVTATFLEAYKVAGVRGLWVGGVARALKTGVSGFLLGPLFEYCHLIADDSRRPLRKPYIAPRDPSSIIVHPRASQAMYIEVR